MTEINSESIVLTALISCVDKLAILEKNKRTMAEKLFNMCSAEIDDFVDFIYNDLPFQHPLGEPLYCVRENMANLERSNFINIQCDLSDVITEEWLQAHREN